MKVLVAVGSKYGASRDIAQAIADELHTLGFEVDCMDAYEVNSVTYYDAVIVGSAVYGGFWRKDAAALIRENADTLTHREVWLFSVGMTSVTQPDQPVDEAEQFALRVGAHEHKRFDGRLQPDVLNFGERALIRAIKPPVGDFRDFNDVKAWAQRVGTDLTTIAVG